MLVGSTAGDFAKQIEIAERGRKREIKPRSNGRLVPSERKARWRTAQIWPMGPEGRRQMSEVLIVAHVNDVDILRQSGRSMDHRGAAADQNEPHLVVDQERQ